MTKSCSRGYKKVGNACRKIKKKVITKSERSAFVSIIFGFVAYSLLGKPIEKFIDSFLVSNLIRIIFGIVAFGLFYYFFKND